MNATCLASLEARGVRILSIHWYSGSSFTISSSTKPWIADTRYPGGIIEPCKKMLFDDCSRFARVLVSNPCDSQSLLLCNISCHFHISIMVKLCKIYALLPLKLFSLNNLLTMKELYTTAGSLILVEV